MIKLTPGMKQYMDIKNANPDCIILFRMGDFYETFFEDAKTIARELEITLTSRGKGDTKAPLAGIPYHAIEPYIAKLVKKGYKVGIVEQTEDPKKAKGLVKRELIRIITPGTVVDSNILDKNKNNYIASIYPFEEKIGISFSDISTGEFLCTTVKKERLISELLRINPSEIVYPEMLSDSEIVKTVKENNFHINTFEDRYFQERYAFDTLTKHLNVLNLDGFGNYNNIEIIASGALLSYLKETQRNELSHINKIAKFNKENVMFLDNATIRNLELLQNLIHKNEDATLLSMVDETKTPMGKRLIKKWIISPLTIKEEIEKRLESVEELKEKIIFRQEIIEELKNVYDIERLIGRVSYGNANPKDVVALGVSLHHIPKIKDLISSANARLLKELSNIPDTTNAKELVTSAIKDEPSITIREGNIIKRGYNSELDELRNLTVDAKSYLTELEEKERDRTNIKSLKIKYNKVIGYYIDVTKPNLHLVPQDYIRKQSQVNSERFITNELKELEERILSAEEKIYDLEFELFNDVIDKLKEYTLDIQETAKNISILDCLISFAHVAQEKGYTKPTFNNNKSIRLEESRHPVIESLPNIDFISNDVNLSNENRTMIITGPNMAGKSTYLRQVALITLMAQAGSFVPAKSANMQITDRVFSRIGAYDDLVNKQSTFMVEMNEAANIVNNATEHSLVILDEIGRGTSTYDGMSLAWAIAEHLNNNLKCKTLFATHYHHLNAMSEKFEGIKNFNVSVDESSENIIFLHKIIPGGTDKSYGIYVAKLAGIPKNIIDSAKEIIQKVENKDTVSQKINSKDQPTHKDKKKKIVLTSGYFDPLHHGHVELFKKSKELGDYLIVVVNNDNQTIQKKGFVFMPHEEKKKIISEIACVDEVIISIDKDQTQCKTLELIKPDIFAKGGDRYSYEIPEANICKEHNIEIIDGVGDKIQSSSDLINNAKENELKRQTENKNEPEEEKLKTPNDSQRINKLENDINEIKKLLRETLKD